MEVCINKILISGQATKAEWAIKGKFIANMDMLNQEANDMVRDITWLINSHGPKWPWHGAMIQLHPDMRPAINDCLRSLREKRMQDPGTTLFVDASKEFWGGILFPGDGQEAINLKGNHKLKETIQKGQNTLEAEAVLRGIEKVHEVLHYGKVNLEYTLTVYCDNRTVVGGLINPHKLNTKQTGYYNRDIIIASSTQHWDMRRTIRYDYM
eukprot:GHVR01111246.1.p1 GENE.GHVR01111246.1~~GHVR01111246.1.p1  ORF type:complete len:210 (+),score=20.79 GHVR01111246.1:427-1056(+)